VPLWPVMLRFREGKDRVMSGETSFRGHSIVCCGTLRPEIRALEESGFLDADRILFTAPGLHESPPDLARQLARQLSRAQEVSERVVVVYGSRCYLDANDPEKDVDTLIEEHGGHVRRVQARNCVDMLAAAEQRDDIAAGERLYWLTPGWVAYWKHIFRDWDPGKANETFPQNDKAVVLDGIGFFEPYSRENPEQVLEFSDWMKIPIEAARVSLDRLKGLLAAQVTVSTEATDGGKQ